MFIIAPDTITSIFYILTSLFLLTILQGFATFTEEETEAQ